MSKQAAKSTKVLPELTGDVDSESQTAWSKRYDNSECAICTEEWKSGDHVVLTQPCSHVLHNKCLDRWAMKCFEEGTDAVSCPVCRQTVECMRHIRCSGKTHKNPTA
jgi:hypothetical protein